MLVSLNHCLYLICSLRHAITTVILSQLLTVTAVWTAPSTKTHREHFSI